MHESAALIGRRFFEVYQTCADPTIVEVGSLDVNGTLGDALPAQATYFGIDMVLGKNVRIVAQGDRLPLRDGIADVAMTTSAFEHDPLFWVTFLELCRIIKPNGLIYLNAPSNGDIHRYPVDCWRFYPDAGLALSAWARRNGQNISCIESFVAERRDDVWNDFVAVFAKPTKDFIPPCAWLADSFGCRNAHRMNEAELLSPTRESEDVRILAQAIGALLRLDALAGMSSAGNKSAGPESERDKNRILKLVGGSTRARLRNTASSTGVNPNLGPFEGMFQRLSTALLSSSNKEFTGPAGENDVTDVTPEISPGRS